MFTDAQTHLHRRTGSYFPINLQSIITLLFNVSDLLSSSVTF